MRGDRPVTPSLQFGARWFTPHARGSTLMGHADPSTTLVYPACAGIDLGDYYLQLLSLRLPRMRGDGPREGQNIGQKYLFTSHARGSIPFQHHLERCFWVYPACAGIIPTGSSNGSG